MPAILEDSAVMSRLLQRTGFGVREKELEQSVRAGMDATLRRVLAAGVGESGKFPLPGLPPLPAKKKDDDKAAKEAYRKAVRTQREKLEIWWLDRMVLTGQPWLEKRTLLWHGHWATSIQKVKSAQAMAQQNETMRRLGGGDFRELARAMVRDPALLIWLDAGKNTAKAPNENLAREFMELFTLGIGHYTENDVRQAAAALTGWRIDRRNPDGPRVMFKPRRHAKGDQTILGTKADFSDRAFVDLLVGRPESPRYLATRLWGWLVAPTPPSTATLDRLVDAYGEDRDITAMIRAMLTDERFAADESVIVKQPIEYAVAAMRAFAIRPSKVEPKKRRGLRNTLRGMGQIPFAPPSVGGWPTGTAWLTTASARARLGFAQWVVKNGDLSAVEDESPSARPERLRVVLGLPAWTDRTRKALTAAAKDPRKVATLALTAPEYVVNG